MRYVRCEHVYRTLQKKEWRLPCFGFQHEQRSDIPLDIFQSAVSIESCHQGVIRQRLNPDTFSNPRRYARELEQYLRCEGQLPGIVRNRNEPFDMLHLMRYQESLHQRWEVEYWAWPVPL